MKFVSIIVPVYNVEEYVERCIQSLYDQNLPQDSYEVIVVDDCSSDKSIEKVEALVNARQYSNLKILRHSVNKRQGGARNTGLELAEGEYIWFVDSDDYILPNVLSQLYELAKRKDLDILHFNFEESTQEGPPYISELNQDEKVYSGCEFAVDPYYDKHINFSLCWQEWIRRDLLVKNNIRFAEHMQFEDVDFAYRIYAKANKVMQTNIRAYHYTIREGSTMNSTYDGRKMRDHIMTIVRSEELLGVIEDKKFSRMILRYIECEISIVGKRATSLPFMERIRYVKLINSQQLAILRHRTSFRNWLRIRYALPV